MYLYILDVMMLTLYITRYLKVVRKHGLEISQPGVEPKNGWLTWQMTKRRGDQEVHK